MKRLEGPCTAVRHGTLSAYMNDGCRCDEARKVHAAWQRDYRRRRMQRTGEKMVHGRFTKEAS